MSFDFSGYQREQTAYGNQQEAAAPALERTGGCGKFFFVAVIVVVGLHCLSFILLTVPVRAFAFLRQLIDVAQAVRRLDRWGWWSHPDRVGEIEELGHVDLGGVPRG